MCCWTRLGGRVHVSGASTYSCCHGELGSYHFHPDLLLRSSFLPPMGHAAFVPPWTGFQLMAALTDSQAVTPEAGQSAVCWPVGGSWRPGTDVSRTGDKRTQAPQKGAAHTL